MQTLAKPIHFSAELLELPESAAGNVAVVDQPMPKLFCARDGAAPAKMHDRIGSASNGLPGMGAQEARLGRSPHREPASRRSAELFHDPEIAAFNASGEIQGQRAAVRRCLRFARRRVRIIIERREIQLPTDAVLVRFLRIRVKIVRNRMTWAVPTDQRDLDLLEGSDRIRLEAGVIEQQRRILERGAPYGGVTCSQSLYSPLHTTVPQASLSCSNVS